VESKSNSPVNIRFFAKTSDIRFFSENIRSDVKTSEVATLIISGEMLGTPTQCQTFVIYDDIGQKTRLNQFLNFSYHDLETIFNFVFVFAS